MHTSKATLTGLLAALTATGCGMQPPPMHPVSPAEAALTVFVEPEAKIGEVKDERGRVLVAPFHDALAGAFTEAGYHVATASSQPHDLTVRVELGRVGYMYGPWADDVMLAVYGGQEGLASVRRDNLAFAHIEGEDVPARLLFAAHVLVNRVTKSARVEAYAASHPPSAAPLATPPASAPATPSAGPTTPPAQTAATASAPTTTSATAPAPAAAPKR